jgi:hypothetical protein
MVFSGWRKEESTPTKQRQVVKYQLQITQCSKMLSHRAPQRLRLPMWAHPTTSSSCARLYVSLHDICKRIHITYTYANMGPGGNIWALDHDQVVRNSFSVPLTDISPCLECSYKTWPTMRSCASVLPSITLGIMAHFIFVNISDPLLEIASRKLDCTCLCTHAWNHNTARHGL